MRNIKLIIEYDGSEFKGWQVQAKGHRTVQDEIRRALKKIFNNDITVYGSGRTDSSVHALGQVANFKIDTSLNCLRIADALNAHLPQDVRIVKAEDVPECFHAQFDAKQKTYRYLILNRRTKPALNRCQVLHYPYKLNVALMKREAAVLVGKHDFLAFQAKDPARDRGNAVRTMRTVRIFKSGQMISIVLTADGFLYKMVRNIVGTLLAIGSGQMPEGSMKKILRSKNRALAGDTAPAHGLCLVSVKYL